MRLARLITGRPLFGRHPVAGERVLLLAIIVMLFVVDWQFGALHHLVDVVQSAETTVGSVVLAISFASWVGAFAYAMRRRFELSAMQMAKAAAEVDAQTAGITDLLTGLPNRASLHNELRRRLVTSASEAGTGLVIGFDIDRFKTLNEVSGHGIADGVLIEVSDRLAVAVDEGDFVARVGADEFHVLTRAASPDEARVKALRLRAAIAHRIEDHDPPLQVATSVGIVMSCAGACDCDAEAIMRRVDIALQYAKSADDGVAIFSPDMELAIREKAELEQALEAAIEAEEIQPHFQPVINLETNRLNGFEVLARWTHPVRGPISPAVFVPLAEETGLLGRMTQALLRRACTVARDWPSHIKIAINISPIDFKNPWLAEEVLQILTDVGFPPRRLEIEITENALVIDHERAIQTITSLKNQGISIALDDFGTGYSSLQQLRMLPFDKIKIDQSFVRTMRENTDSRMIVKAIIGLSGSLGLPTTAEGIETSNSAEDLRAYGCTLGQGFFYSQAVPADDVPGLLALLGDGDTTAASGVAENAAAEPLPIARPSHPAHPTIPEAAADDVYGSDLDEIRRLA